MSAFQEQVDVGPDPLWWLWILIAVLFILVIVYVVRNIHIGGPWMR